MTSHHGIRSCNSRSPGFRDGGVAKIQPPQIGQAVQMNQAGVRHTGSAQIQSSQSPQFPDMLEAAIGDSRSRDA